MSLVNNNMSPLPFFHTLAERDKWYAYGRQYHLMCDNKLLPFVIRRAKRLEWLGGDDAGVTRENKSIGANGVYQDEIGAVVAEYEIATVANQSLRINRTHLYGDGLQIALYKDQEFWGGIYFDGEVTGSLSKENVTFDNNYIEITNLPEQIDVVAVCLILFPGLDYTERVYYSLGLPQEATMYFVSEGEDIELGMTYVVTKGNYDYLYYKGEGEPSVSGSGYIKVDDGVEQWYSAQLCVGDVSKLLKIEWWDIEDFSPIAGDFLIPYSEGYRNFLYFKTDICYPTYQYEDEVLSRDGYQFPVKQISYKQYQFKILATEEVCDAMRMIHMSDYVHIIQGEKEYDANTFVGEVAWQDSYIASMDCEFTTDTIVKKKAKYVNIQ